MSSSGRGIKRRGLMLVLSSPSGAGKTTISRALLDGDDNLTLSVSVTTREPRPGERDGVDYRFIDRAQFEAMAKAGDLLEHAEVFDNGYGTPRAEVERALAAGRDVLFDIDWQGTQQLKAAKREDVVSVFVLPPSTGELERRLHSRAQDSAETVRARMAKASDEMSHWAEYDYIVINREIGASVRQARSILEAERLRRERQIGLHGFVGNLRRG
ncbi:MAG: guanylate kinase [Rhodospirillaceae bacterium]|nr:guanylate kinase [Rhodospirillaceae bacterium]MYF86413.1 guanylate kinase [Rhodospirillaceae bacterium]MYH36483.1 guanylate kinase [Rhodospirillaceae bacterium]MYK13314.1 guanylate kinase [Rhodospirillaceae bacterium]MYK58217.1 guanylate kinase [Rhodospirillaceae bacterium]